MFAPDQFISDFEALSKLLSPQDNDAAALEHSNGMQAHGGHSGTPATIGSRELLPVTVAQPRGARVDAQKAAGSKQQQKPPAAPADEKDLAFDRDDGREVPSHDLVYKQAVGTSDAFLGMSGKDPSSACCETLVVRIRLPQAASSAGLDLDVRPTRLRLLSEHYKLLLHLPRKVDADRGRARWDTAKRELAVSAPIVDEDRFP